MESKLRSRKLWITVATVAILSLTDQLGIDHETANQIVAVAATYLLAQGAHDVVKVKRTR